MRAKDIPAADASTGEQKALLIGLVLAHAGLLAEMTGFAPVLLLDEVVAHLDPARRAALYDELERLGAQVWMTGADPAAFAEIEPRAQVFEVTPGRVARRAAGSLTRDLQIRCRVSLASACRLRSRFAAWIRARWRSSARLILAASIPRGHLALGDAIHHALHQIEVVLVAIGLEVEIGGHFGAAARRRSS